MPTCGDYTMRAQPRRRVSEDKEEPIFLRKTFEMISEDNNNNLACWTENGETFVVKDPDVFAQVVIPRFFKHSKFSSFVRQLNFYGFRKVKSSISSEGSDSKWWEFKHDLFHRDKPHLLADMRRATHYGVAADKQEVEHLRLEVTRLRNHIDGMGDKIGQLTSLVESLAVESNRPPPPAAATAAGAGTAPCNAGVSASDRSRAWEEGDSGLHGVGVGLGRLSFGCASGDQEEDAASEFFPPAVPAGAYSVCGGMDAAATDFLPLRTTMPRKRKLIRLDNHDGKGCGSGGDGIGGALIDEGVPMPIRWPLSGTAATTGIVKQEIDLDLVKQEIVMDPTTTEKDINNSDNNVEEISSSKDVSPWQLFLRRPQAAVPLEKTAATTNTYNVTAAPSPDGTSSVSNSTAAAVEGISIGGGSGSNNSEFLQGFTDQFLSFESPMASFMPPSYRNELGGGVAGATAHAVPALTCCCNNNSSNVGGGTRNELVRVENEYKANQRPHNKSAVANGEDPIKHEPCSAIAAENGKNHHVLCGGNGGSEGDADSGNTSASGNSAESYSEEETNIDICGDDDDDDDEKTSTPPSCFQGIVVPAAPVVAAVAPRLNLVPRLPFREEQAILKGVGEKAIANGVGRGVVGEPSVSMVLEHSTYQGDEQQQQKQEQQQQQQQPVVMRESGTASSAFPPHIEEELHNNLESLPLHNKTKLKEGLSALMQHPTFLAALMGQGGGGGGGVSAPVAMSITAAEPQQPRPNINNPGKSTTTTTLGSTVHSSSGTTTAATAIAGSISPGRVSPMMVDDRGGPPIKSAGGVGDDAVGSSIGSGGGGGGGCCSGRSQERGNFGERLPRSEEAACA